MTTTETTKEKADKPADSLLVKQEMYLEAGIHIGTRIRTDDMKKFIFKKRDDGLYILDLRQSDERLRVAAKLLASYDPNDVLVVASRMYSGNPASKFSALTGIPALAGRFIPGTMTNLSYPGFKEPKIIFVCDPKGEQRAISEAAKIGVPVIALCDTDNETKFIDWIIPSNNKGKRSLALIFYILTREIQMAQGKIKTYDEFQYPISYFEQFEVKEEKKPVAEGVQEAASAEPKAEEKKPVEKADLKPEKKHEHKKEAPKEEKKE